eukprot:SAG11_NODE_21994_length_414_cov_1.133333_1_plen_94_part_01
MADYEVSCLTYKHQIFQSVALIMIVAFSAGTPIVIMQLMRRTRESQKKQFMTPEWQYITRQVAAEFGHDSIRDVRQCIMDIKLGNHYGFLVSAF